MKRPPLTVLGLVFMPVVAAGQSLSTQDLCEDSGVSCFELAQALVGPDVIVSNVQCRGACHALGLFSGGAQSIGFANGVVLGTGTIADIVGPNNDPAIRTENLQPGDPALESLVPPIGNFCNPILRTRTCDAAVLEFDFQFAESCQGVDTLSFQYVFASDEYHEYTSAGNPFNDVFGFFLNGVNIALVPGTQDTPASIATINCGQGYTPQNLDCEVEGFCGYTFRDCPPYGGPNCILLRNNSPDTLGSCDPDADPIDTQMDALSVVLTAHGSVDTGALNHVVLAIADFQDYKVDSNVFLRFNSFDCQPPTGACCDSSTGVCTENLLAADCTADWYAGVDCAHVYPPCQSPRMVVLLDRTGSMNEIRSQSGNTRCFDALEIAIGDVTAFFVNHPTGRVAVWTFNGTDPVPRTNGFVDEATALAALNAPALATCGALTPLAESLCEAADLLAAQLSDPTVGDLILAVSSDGLENNSDGECLGPASVAGVDCGEYDAGSWQQKVCDKLTGTAVVMVRFWGSLLLPRTTSSTDPETGEALGGGVSDFDFFTSLAESTGGAFVFHDDDGPTAAQLGACCDPIGRCIDGLTEEQCSSLGGSPLPGGSTCEQVLTCSPRAELIPAASTWGLLLFSLATVTAGTMIFRVRRGKLSS